MITTGLYTNILHQVNHYGRPKHHGAQALLPREYMSSSILSFEERTPDANHRFLMNLKSLRRRLF